MLSRLILLVTAAGLATAASVGDQVQPERDSKLFPVVQIVTFDNAACVGASHSIGTCYSQKECSALGGVADGTCANGFGVCCSVSASCGDTITANNTNFISPNYPSAYNTAGMCMAILAPPAGTCQVLLTFESFTILGPQAGDCNNDTFSVTGTSNDFGLPTICGENAGQHMYFSTEGSTGPFKLVFSLSSQTYTRSWKIRVTYIEIGNPCKAPYGCLQYFKPTSGSLKSFNYGSAYPLMINNLNYAICFAYTPGYCDIGITFDRFDLGNVNGNCNNDFVSAGGTQLCGDYNTQAYQVNCTGPTNIIVATDGNNDRLEEGFSGTYMKLPY